MDSMQIYAELKVGTARPNPSLAGEAAQHLFGFTSVRHPLSTYRYAEEARKVMAEIQSRGRIPMLVGGTGLYMRALFEGLDNLPLTPAELRARLDRLKTRRGGGWLHKMLQRLDPQGAEHLHPNDSQRIMRFLEVRILTGKSMLDHWRKKEQNALKPLTLGLQVDRPILDACIHRQVKNRLAQGWIEETQALIETGLLENVLKIGPIGYGHVADLIAGKLKLDQALEQIYRATRRYAKRQMTWFRKASYIQWFPFEPESGYNINGITEVVKGNAWGKHS